MWTFRITPRCHFCANVLTDGQCTKEGCPGNTLWKIEEAKKKARYGGANAGNGGQVEPNRVNPAQEGHGQE